MEKLHKEQLETLERSHRQEIEELKSEHQAELTKLTVRDFVYKFSAALNVLVMCNRVPRL